MTNAQEKGSGSKVKSLFPILTWLSHYNWKDIRFDLIAGIVVAGLIIPESMGIAGVAGVEPQHGLYAILIALFLYAIFGSGRRSVVSVPSAMALLTASAIATLALTAYEDVLAAVVTITLLTGLILPIQALYILRSEYCNAMPDNKLLDVFGNHQVAIPEKKRLTLFKG